MTEVALVKVRITEDMIGKTAFIAMQEDVYSVVEWGEPFAIKFIPGPDPRSIEQNNLYFACLGIMVENKNEECIIVHVEGAEDIKEFIWSTKEKAHSQVRWACKYIDTDSIIHVPTKTGSRLYFQLDSVSFAKSKQKKVNAYYTQAFEYMAGELGITVPELIAEAQSRMKGRRICRICGSTQKMTGHHKLSQTDLYKELYPEYINHPDNKIDYCIDCHENKTIEKWTEAEFCKHFGIEVRSKSGKGAA